MTTFAQASIVSPSTEADGHFVADISADWTIGGNPNGGYLLAVMAKAVAHALPQHPDPLAANAHYLSPPAPGAARVEVEVLRSGKRASQVRAVLWQGNTRRVESLMTMGRLGVADAPTWSDLPADRIAPIEECFRLPSNPPRGIAVTIMDHVKVFADPADLGWAVGKPNGEALIRAWVELHDEVFTSAALLYAAVSLPPATLGLGSVGWVPTFELTVYVRAIPAPGPLQVSQRAHLIDAGTVDEVCTIWDSTGRLVAQATQLAGVRMA